MIRKIVNGNNVKKLKKSAKEWLEKNDWLIEQNAKEAKKMKDLLNERGIRKANEEMGSVVQQKSNEIS